MSIRTIPKVLTALVAAALLLCLFATTAAAVPKLGVELTRIQAPINRGDERLVYEATVKNEASSNPKLGGELTCRGTPEDGVSWFGTPAPTFAFEWLRDGAAIAGATAKTYTVAAADQGKSIQCVVLGTSDPDGAGTTYAPTSSASVSPPPVVVEPLPATAGPSGSSRPDFSGSFAAAPHGTATTTAGSDTLTEVATAEGTGTLAAGSKTVTGLTTSTGGFMFNQVITGPCIPAETSIAAVGIDTLELSQAAVGSCSGALLKAGAQPFGPGQGISGIGIPAGTKVLKATNNGVSGQTVVMSNNATASATGVAIAGTSDLTCAAPTGWTAGSAIDWSFQWLRNGAPIPGATTAVYTVQTADTEPPSILQCEAIAEDGDGNKAIAISGNQSTSPRPPNPYQPPGGGTPSVDFGNQTSGPVELELELPGGEETYAYKAVSGVGQWVCTKTAPTPSAHATVRCIRPDQLSPQASFAPVEIVISVGKNPPNTLTTKAKVTGGGSAEAGTEDVYTIPNPALPFGFKAFKTEVLDDLGNDYTQAGGHPFTAGASLEFKTHVRAELEAALTEAVNGATRVVKTDTPAGFVGNPRAVTELCPSVSDILATPSECPAASVVGSISSVTSIAEIKNIPIYAIEPEYGVAAQFAFKLSKYVYTLAPELRPEDGYAISLVTSPLAKNPEVFSASVKLCGFGAKVAASGGAEQVVQHCLKASEAGGAIPLITNPTHCSGPPPTTKISADTWEEPGNYVSAEFTSPPLSGCEQVDFEPRIKLQPTSRQADSPTGMDVEISMPTNGLEGRDDEGNFDPEAVAQANLKGSTVTLPVGMAVNPAAASGLDACTLAQIGMSASGVPNADPIRCPESAKVGNVEARTPLLEETLNGNVYIAKQGDNPFGSLLALYLVIDSPKNGILVKLAGRVTPDPVTGQLVVSFDDNPEVPIENVKLHFAGGERAALINPPLCGDYAIGSELTPWSAQDPDNPTSQETVSLSSSFVVDEGPGGGPCPTGALEPRLRAGVSNPTAGATTPFVLGLSREDGTQRFRALDVTMPPGLVGYLKGIPYCSEAALASIPSAEGSGAAQLVSSACPSASLVGTVTVGAGAGASPFYVDTGRAYLTGPYKGAPLSLAIVTPAVAGPFDLGNVVVRTALSVNPETAQITAVSDPIPTILKGIPLDVRDIRVNVDRPNFTVAPTNCEPLAVSAQVTGEQGASASVSDRFQVGGCERLKFKPNLKLRLHGGTKRGDYQRLVATLTYPPGAGYANVASAAVTFPHSTFLAQEHINTICTRVQFAAKRCPRGSIYGYAKATSPLVDYTLAGPVYLRSSSHPLPDVVVALRGPDSQPLEINLAGRVDSKDGGIRNTFALVPDAPVSKFTLEMKGGRKSLLVNSRDLCKGTQRATVRMSAQNGKSRNFRPVVGNDCKGKPKPKR